MDASPRTGVSQPHRKPLRRFPPSSGIGRRGGIGIGAPLFTQDNQLAEKVSAEGAMTRKQTTDGLTRIEAALLNLPKQEQLTRVVGGTVRTEGKVTNFPSNQKVTLDSNTTPVTFPTKIIRPPCRQFLMFILQKEKVSNESGRFYWNRFCNFCGFCGLQRHERQH